MLEIGWSVVKPEARPTQLVQQSLVLDLWLWTRDPTWAWPSSSLNGKLIEPSSSARKEIGTMWGKCLAWSQAQKMCAISTAQGIWLMNNMAVDLLQDNRKMSTNASFKPRFQGPFQYSLVIYPVANIHSNDVIGINTKITIPTSWHWPLIRC